MIKLLKGSFTWTIGIISIIFTFVPESSFQKYKLVLALSDEVNIILNRVLVFILVLFFSLLIKFIYLLIRKSLIIKGKNYIVEVEYGDILKEKNCKRVISFDECFTTIVGDAPSEIKPSSICGQYLAENPNINIQNLISNAGLQPSRTKSKYNHKERFDSGKIVPNGDDLLMAFAQLDEEGKGKFFSHEEFLNCLSVLWKEIDKYYGQKDVCIPVLGSGITRMNDSSLTQQELLDIIIESYKLSSHKIKSPCKLRIICKKRKDFSLDRIGGIS